VRTIIIIGIFTFTLTGCVSKHTSTAQSALFLQGMVGAYSAASLISPDVSAAANFALAAENKILNKANNSDNAIQLISIDRASKQVVAGYNYKLEMTVNINGVGKKILAIVYQGLSSNPTFSLTSWVWIAD
jgi:hypothetical protein